MSYAAERRELMRQRAGAFRNGGGQGRSFGGGNIWTKTWKTWVKEGSGKRPHAVWFHFYELFRRNKSTETESRSVAAGTGGRGMIAKSVLGFLLGWDVLELDIYRWWLDDLVNAQHAAELCTLTHKLRYVTYILKNAMSLPCTEDRWRSEREKGGERWRN